MAQLFSETGAQVREVPLSKGFVALVDDEDFELVSSVSWYARKGLNTYYAERKGPRDAEGKRKVFSMHRLVMGLGPGEGGIVDHVNRNGLDNRRENLRVTDKSGNALNSERARQPRPCETCGEDYLPGTPQARYCSVSCARRRPDHPRSQRTLVDVRCPTCETEFRPHSHRTRYCSKSCSNRGRSRALGLR